MGNRRGQIVSIIKDKISWTGDPAVWIINLVNELSCKRWVFPSLWKWAFLLLFNGQLNSHPLVFFLPSNPPPLSRSAGSHWACPEHFVCPLPSLSLTPYMPPLTPSVSNCTTHSSPTSRRPPPSPTSCPASKLAICPLLTPNRLSDITSNAWQMSPPRPPPLYYPSSVFLLPTSTPFTSLAC